MTSSQRWGRSITAASRGICSRVGQASRLPSATRLDADVADELRASHRQVEPLLNFPIIWLDDATRQVVAEAFGRTVRAQKYTCYACAILKNHAHLVIRRHRDDYQTMFAKLSRAAADALRSCAPLRLAANHPVFSQRPYSAYCYTTEDIRDRIEYVENNPEKEGLPPQRYEFVAPYDNWPHHKRAQR